MDEKQLQELESEEQLQPAQELQSDDDQVTPGFSLEDIMKEFGADAQAEAAEEVAPEETASEEVAEEAEEEIKIVGQISDIVPELPEEPSPTVGSTTSGVLVLNRMRPKLMSRAAKISRMTANEKTARFF